MTFARVNPLGWAYLELLTSAQMNALDINVSRSLDGYSGGTYNPSNPLQLNHKLILDSTGKADHALAITTDYGGSALELLNTGVGKGLLCSTVGDDAVNAGTQDGVAVNAYSQTNYGVVARGADNPTLGKKAAFRIMEQSAHPGSLDEGAIWLRSDVHWMYAYLDGAVNDIVTKNHPIAAKAWAALHTDGAGNVVVDKQWNVNSAVIGTTNYHLKVFWENDPPNADYSTWGMAAADGCFITNAARATTYAEFKFYDTSVPGNIDLSANSRYIQIGMFARE